MLNDRSFKLIVRNVGRPRNYASLIQAAVIFERPLAFMPRYFLGSGDYPCNVRVRTPIGPQSVKLYNSHDAITVHEIFCREDYRCSTPPKVIVDLGSNIGVSALYFLTRSSSSFCELYEPDPRNHPKLLSNIQRFSDRFVLHRNAVADTEGVLPFACEPTGRYGSLNIKSVGTDTRWQEGIEEISVQVEHINTVLDRAIGRHGVVDLLKIDTEGSELATLRAIDPSLLTHIRNIAIEWADGDISLDGFNVSSSCDVIRFSKMATVQL